MGVEAQNPIIEVAGSEFICEANDRRTSLTKI